MIPVAPQPEPVHFEHKVRQPGMAWLERNNIVLHQPLPPGTKLAPVWRECLQDLYQSYNGVCAYLAVYFERATGGATVDHFIAKSSHAALAYEWHNYRLASATMNSRKRAYDDVLDPFEIQLGWFWLELVSGRIFPNRGLDGALLAQVGQTIVRLGLDDGMNREMRARHYQQFCDGLITAGYLARHSPLVFAEARRQGLVGL